VNDTSLQPCSWKTNERLEMKLTANGKVVELDNEVTVIDLLKILEVKTPEYVSIQINDEILSREDYDKTKVKENDSIEFLYFMGGGK
jgi:sulfur carrier protein